MTAKNFLTLNISKKLHIKVLEFRKMKNNNFCYMEKNEVIGDSSRHLGSLSNFTL